MDNFVANLVGIFGIIVAFMVYLAPLPTFLKIFKRKSSEGFPCLPYSMALFSAMMTLYYGRLKKFATIISVINSIGCAIEITYLMIFLIYPPLKSRIFTAKLLLFFNFLVYGVIMAVTSQIHLFSMRLKVVGWINTFFNLCVFAAPLSNMRLIIQTKSVEYMSFPLSVSLTMCAVIWFIYGLLIKDIFIAAPNILGFAFGVGQMILFFLFKNNHQPEQPAVVV